MSRRLRTAVAAVLPLALGAGVAAGAMTDGTSSSGTVTTGTLRPATGLSGSHPDATGASAGQVNLTWTASGSPFVAGYRVLEAPAEGGPWSTLATLGPAATAHADTGAPYNGERYYRIQAFRDLWTSDTAILSSHSLPMQGGTDRVGGSGPGTALTGPWTAGGTQLAALSVADATRYQPAAWPAAPNTMLGAFYLDVTHAWVSGTSTIAAFDGTGWTAQSPGAGSNLEQVVFANTTTGWAVGQGGTIRATADGGATWASQASGTARNLRDIDCATATTCWAVGDNGTIRATADVGATWTGQTSGTTRLLWDVDCVSARVCRAVGASGAIVATTDGGATWKGQTSGVGTQLRGLSCLDASRCWAAGDNGVIRVTANGGATWTGLTSGTTQTIRSIVMVNATVGYLAGDGSQVRKTTDGGTSWTPLTVPAAAYQSVSCIGVTRCLIVSDLGSVLMSSDGGATWGEQASRYVELTPVTPAIPAGGTVGSVAARLVYRTTTVPGAGTRLLLMASADGGETWATFDLTTPAAANTDVTQSVDLASLGFTPATRAQTIRLRFAAVPQGGALTAQLDLVHVDVN